MDECDFFTVVVYRYSEHKKFLDCVINISNPHETILRAAITNAIAEEKPEMTFSAENHI